MHPAADPRPHRGPAALAGLLTAIAAGVLTAVLAAPWHAARGDLLAVRAAVHWHPPGGWFDPSAAIDRWLASPETPAADRLAAAAALIRRDRCTWSHRSVAAMHAWLGDAAEFGPTGLDERTFRGVLWQLAAMPEHPEPDRRRTLQAWLAADAAVAAAPESAEPDAVRRLRGVIFGRVGAVELADPAFDRGSPRTRRLRHLALESVPEGLQSGVARIIADGGPPTMAAAALVRLASLEPLAVARGEPVAADLARLAPADASDLALWIAGRSDPAAAASADAALAARAAAGRVPAARLRAAADFSAAHRPPPSPAAVLEAPDAEAALRAALAAIRIPTPLPPTFADAMLEDEWVGPTLAALVAAASLAPPDAAELAATWIAALSDRRKQAGAVLVALRPEADADTIDQLQRAHAREDRPEVRLVQHATLAVLGRTPVGGPDLRLLRHAAAASARPTLALLAALGGDRSALADLLPAPGAATADDASALATLEASIARLVPHWSAAVGPIPGGGPDARRLQIDRLEARRLLESPRLIFDPVTRQFDLPDPAGLPAPAAATIILP